MLFSGVATGVMGVVGIFRAAHCVVLCLLQITAVSSERFTVTGLQRPVLAPLGGMLELSCQLSPPQQAQHMEIRWFRNHYTQPVHLYRNGKDLHGETISKYVERTELLKDAIGKGKVTLRIFKVTADDDGSYHCLFKDGEFYEEHITEAKVTATSSDIQIHMHPPNIKGVMLECHSGGWFPEPRMEWRDSKGELIPAVSKSHSQDENKLFHVTMALLTEGTSHQNVTCYLQNLLTQQEESLSIVLSGELFSWKTVWIKILSLMALTMIDYCMTFCVHLMCGKFAEESGITLYNGQYRFEQSESKASVQAKLSSYCEGICQCLKDTRVLMISGCAITGSLLFLHLKQRVSVSDPLFELDTLWLEDISVILCVMIVFIIKLISCFKFITEENEQSPKWCLLQCIQPEKHLRDQQVNEEAS